MTVLRGLITTRGLKKVRRGSGGRNRRGQKKREYTEEERWGISRINAGGEGGSRSAEEVRVTLVVAPQEEVRAEVAENEEEPSMLGARILRLSHTKNGK